MGDEMTSGDGGQALAPFEVAVRRWAATEYGHDAEVIKDVDFDVNTSSGCPTCGPETDLEVTIWFTDGRRPEFHERNPHDLGELMRALFAAGAAPTEAPS